MSSRVAVPGFIVALTMLLPLLPAALAFAQDKGKAPEKKETKPQEAKTAKTEKKKDEKKEEKK